MGDHAAPQRAFGGDLQRIGMHPEPGDAEALEMGHPRLLVFEALAFVPSEPGDHQPREAPAAHVSQRLVVDHVVGGASPQKRRKFSRLFARVVANQAKSVLPMCVQAPFMPL